VFAKGVKRVSAFPIARPEVEEYPAYYRTYVDKLAGADAIRLLGGQRDAAITSLRSISEERSVFRYAPEKWSIRELLGHLIDSERVFTYRALRFARADATPLAGFDEDAYVRASGYHVRDFRDIVDEFESVRGATLSFFGGLTPEQSMLRGTANQGAFTVRALAYIVGGHVEHHLGVLRDRYL